MLAVLKFFLARSTEHGSRSLVNAVEGGKETHGQYLSDCRVTPYVRSLQSSFQDIFRFEMADFGITGRRRW